MSSREELHPTKGRPTSKSVSQTDSLAEYISALAAAVLHLAARRTDVHVHGPLLRDGPRPRFGGVRICSSGAGLRAVICSVLNYLSTLPLPLPFLQSIKLDETFVAVRLAIIFRHSQSLLRSHLAQ